MLRPAKDRREIEVPPRSKTLQCEPRDLALLFPADDLDNFFRNGGTLTLGYADIPLLPAADTDDFKAVAAVGHATIQVTRGATTGAYAAGAVIINEIMWGLDAGQE